MNISISNIDNWEFNKFFSFILSIQFIVIGIISLEYLGIQTPFLREIITSFYLIFIPGIIILRIFRINNLNIIKTLMLSTGLSIIFIIVFGILINYATFLGVKQPFSAVIILPAIILGIFILLLLAFLRDKDSSKTKKKLYFSLKGNVMLLLILIILLGILGALSINFFQNNILFMIIILIISIIPILVYFRRINSDMFPLAIMIIALTLLLSSTLVSMHTISGDIRNEEYFSTLTLYQGYWDQEITENYNSVPSVTIFPVIYSIFSSIPINWIFKLVYPLIFSLVPLGLYEVYRKQTSKCIAFYSAFFFISFNIFFISLTTIPRQQIGELFLVLILLSLVDIRLKDKRSLLIIIFGFGLIVSHYSLSYIFMFFIIGTFILIGIRHILSKKLELKPLKNLFSDKKTKEILSVTYILFYVVLIISWYMYTSGGSVIENILSIFNNIIGSIATDFFSSDVRESTFLYAIGAAPLKPYLVVKINAAVHYLAEFIIILGFLALFFKEKITSKFTLEYKSMVLFSVILLASSIIIPNLSSGTIESRRIMHISLIFLSPFFVLGFEVLLNFLSKIKRLSSIDTKKIKFGLVITLLIPFFLFESGLIYNLAGNHDFKPISIQNYKESDNSTEQGMYYITYPKTQDVYSIQWIHDNNVNNSVYGDLNSIKYILSPKRIFPQNKRFLFSQMEFSNESYIFLNYFNIKENKILMNYTGSTMEISKTSDFIFQINLENKIYSNGGSEFYYSS